jgi:hypothetical protein
VPGSLSCALVDLRLLAGRYIVCATLLDASIRYPLAVESSHSRTCHIDACTDPDPVTNILIWAKQPVRLDAEWIAPHGDGGK